MANNSNGGGVGIGGAFLILFVGLKLGGVINWSWGWVLSPLWLPIVLVVAVVMLAAILKSK